MPKTTHEILTGLIENELSVAQYKQSGDWFETHLERLVAESFLKVDNIIMLKEENSDFTEPGKILGFALNYKCGFIVKTTYANFLYWELREATDGEKKKFIEDNK